MRKVHAKFTSTEDNKIMPEFHSVDWDKTLGFQNLKMRGYSTLEKTSLYGET